MSECERLGKALSETPLTDWDAMYHLASDAIMALRNTETRIKEFESSIKAQLGECFDGIEDGPVLDMIRSTGRVFASAMAEQARFDKRVAELERTQ